MSLINAKSLAWVLRRAGLRGLKCATLAGVVLVYQRDGSETLSDAQLEQVRIAVARQSLHVKRGALGHVEVTASKNDGAL